MARSSHITVNLLLIVAITMQSGMACDLQRDCAVPEGFARQGCGCCQARTGTTKCKCCSSKAANDKEGGCCEPERPKRVAVLGQHRDAFADASNAFADASRKAGAVPAAAIAVDSLAAACNCRFAPQPFAVPGPRSLASELRHVLTVSVVHGHVELLADVPPLAPAFDANHCSLTPRFSQIAFGVWRL